ncbi:glycosyltransferase [Clostridium folliculivorans]|uniref:glycosyltransferase n=1 Tax=Clostridium folliculivorans TaxID=2886038 RepID=UPI0021C3A1AE|nr:glycosyltransferase [Clostridium folliculivorans]GKU31664.1 glycosyl transferase family 2 [Clostridium folliculivorans]
MKMNSVCCIIVTYNIGNEFYKCFNAIKDQVEEVVIVDNGSDKKTVDVLNKIKTDKEGFVIFNNDNMGIAYALNQGVDYALTSGYKWILTMDNDSIATKNMIDGMLNSYDKLDDMSKKDTVSIFPVYVERAYTEDESIESNKYCDEYEYVLSEITSGNIIRADVFNIIGKFEEKFFIDYVDHEFCLRIASKGYKAIRGKQCFLLHQLGNSEKRVIMGKEILYTNHSALRRYYTARNSMYVWKKYIRKFPKFVVRDILFFIKKNLLILLFEKHKLDKFRMTFKGIVDFMINKFGKINI